jgi:hypothetical protein
MVINEVKSRMLVYSQHKFASNVVEKCLQVGGRDGGRERWRSGRVCGREDGLNTSSSAGPLPPRSLPLPRAQYGSKAERNDIIDEVVRSVLDKSSLLQVMVRDPYGNYVVQKILDIADDRQQEALCTYLRSCAPQLRRYTYGKHILVRLEKISGEKLV